jgi:hypothetical protein
VKLDVYRLMELFGAAACAVAIHDPAYDGMSFRNGLEAGRHGSIGSSTVACSPSKPMLTLSQECLDARPR